MEPGVWCVPASEPFEGRWERWCCWGVKGAAGGCGGASDGCWMRNSALLTPVFYQSWQRLELYFKEEENKCSWKKKCFIGLFFLLSFSITPTHTHIHTWGSQILNRSFWSFYRLKKSDILKAYTVMWFKQHCFFHNWVWPSNIFTFTCYSCHFSLSIAIIGIRKTMSFLR